jgi:predicted phosphoribosyltransferase
MQAALWAARHEHPQKLVAALPVGPEETIRQLARYADEALCLRSPVSFSAVGQFYQFFHQLEDNEVMAIIREEQAERKTGVPEI